VPHPPFISSAEGTFEPGPLFEAVPDAYLVLDPRLVIIGASDAYLRATGATRTGLVGRYLFDAFPDNPGDPHADGVANLRASLERVLAHRLPDRMRVQKYDIPVAGGAFEERYWSPLNSPVLDPAGEVRWIIHRVEDVTTLVQLGLPATPAEIEDYARKTQAALDSTEEQLRQAQKLEALGRLAGGVAHDFNNLLSVILTTAGLLREDLGSDARVQADLRQIEQAGLRAGELTRSLLAFSRQQVLDLRVLELRAVVGDLQPILKRLLREDIETRIRLDERAGCVRGDKAQLEQVILNLAINSRDAMPSGGLFSIEVAPVELDAEYAESHTGVTPGRYVCMTVSDTGVGMDRETQARAFEPFFTTKPPGEGTGLGLSTVFGIVKQSGGFIWLYSERGIGTTFKIYFPRVDGPPSPVEEGAPTAAVGGGERILVLEDEDAVRHSVVRVLRRLGYEVFDTASGAEALVRCATAGAAPDLLITDVIMPEMNGRELAERARLIVPGLKVLFISGYTDDVILQHGILASGVPYLQKPITPEALGQRVRGILDA
jgi:two-component system cell cycle sensor histidine kinase/response regulator CckA